jgi:hypothetical protein
MSGHKTSNGMPNTTRKRIFACAPTQFLQAPKNATAFKNGCQFLQSSSPQTSSLPRLDQPPPRVLRPLPQAVLRVQQMTSEAASEDNASCCCERNGVSSCSSSSGFFRPLCARSVEFPETFLLGALHLEVVRDE